MKLKLTLKPPFILYNDNDTLCECGEHKKCVRKINTSDNGRLWVENKDHFRCGKIRNKIMNYSARGCMYCEGVCNKECLPKQDIIKTEEDAKIFVEALENIPEPNDKLKKAFRDFGKQETLEEAIKRLCVFKVSKVNDEMRSVNFEIGAKWQQERSYSEEEVKYLLEVQRGNCYVALLSHTKNDDIASVALGAPEPGGRNGTWVK